MGSACNLKAMIHYKQSS